MGVKDVQGHAEEHVRVVKAIAMGIASATAMKHFKVVAKNHVVAVALILVQEVQSNDGDTEKPSSC